MSSDAARTRLAARRNVMAAERTLMAWIRTSLAMISFGFTIGKLGDALDSTKFELMFGRAADIKDVASYMVVIGTLALILAATQYRTDLAHIAHVERAGWLRLPSLAFIVAILLSLLGIFVFTDLVVRL